MLPFSLSEAFPDKVTKKKIIAKNYYSLMVKKIDKLCCFVLLFIGRNKSKATFVNF